MSAVSVKVLQAIVAGASARGVSVELLLQAAQLTPEKLSGSDGYLPRASEIRLWQEAARLTGDENFGLSLAESLQVGDFGALGFAVRSSATIGEGYQRVARFLHLMIRDVELRILPDGEVARLRHVPPPSGPGPARQAVEFLMATLLLIGRKGTDGAVTPREVCFRHAPPARLDEHHRVFGPEVRFAREHDELVVELALLSLPSRQAEPALSEVLDRHLQELVSRLPADLSFLERVRGCLAAELQRGEPTLEAVAHRLHMSPRSLQRRLQEEDTSLQEQLNGLRADLAVRYLSEDRESISEIAFLLGFSEVSTFHRAFKRWTGVTPAAYRRSPPAKVSTAHGRGQRTRAG